MAGEMSQAEVTRDAYPWHFAAADEIGGEVRAFDQYQGPYVTAQGHGRYWLCSDSAGRCYWYDERRELKSSKFIGNVDQAMFAFRDLLARGGCGAKLSYSVVFTAMVPINVTIEVEADSESEACDLAYEQLGENLMPEDVEFENAKVYKLSEWEIVEAYPSED